MTNNHVGGVLTENAELYKKLITSAAELGSPCLQDPETWYSQDPDDIAYARKLCYECPVREMCLEYAIRNQEHGGLWGGEQEPTRRAIRVRRLAEERNLDDV